jgi:hypothetical protein
MANNEELVDPVREALSAVPKVKENVQEHYLYGE